MSSCSGTVVYLVLTLRKECQMLCSFITAKLLAFEVFRSMSLEAEQFSIQTDPETKLRYILFKGRAMKNVQGGLNHRKVTPQNSETF